MVHWLPPKVTCGTSLPAHGRPSSMGDQTPRSTCSGPPPPPPNAEPATGSLLWAKGFPYREVELVACTLEDKPGTLAEATRKLAEAGINIEACLPPGMSGSQGSGAFATSDPAKARGIFGQLARAP